MHARSAPAASAGRVPYDTDQLPRLRKKLWPAVLEH